MRALASPSQLREQMTWFWMNHFSVFSGKANVRWTLAEYEERRAHARARTLPRSRDGDGDVAGDARVSRQRAERRRPDQRELRARVDGAAHARRQRRPERRPLHAAGRAGAGADSDRRRRQRHGRDAEAAARSRRRSTSAAVCSSSIRRATTSAPKTVLGHTVAGRGFDEVERAVDAALPPAGDRALRQPQARHLLRRRRPAGGARRPDGAHVSGDRRLDRRRAARRCSCDRDFVDALAAPAPKLDKFKDPMQFVVSSLRLAYDGKVIR